MSTDVYALLSAGRPASSNTTTLSGMKLGRFRIAMVEAFNMTFGDDENDIEAWGRMCMLVDVEHIPDTLVARREVRKSFSLIPS